MHIYFIQHSSLMPPARFVDWLTANGHSFNQCRLDLEELPPSLEDFDALIVLDALEPPNKALLKREEKLIARVIKSNKPILAIGFGAGLVAGALGTIVSRAVKAEFGWRAAQLHDSSPFDLPEEFHALLWHDTIFGLPHNALPLGSSAQTPVLGFAWDQGRVVGLLPHFEWREQEWAALLEYYPVETDSECVNPAELSLQNRAFDFQAALLDRIMTQWLLPYAL